MPGNSEAEQWRPIPSSPDYEANSAGRIRTAADHHVLVQYPNPQSGGAPQVRVRWRGRWTTRLVRTLVAEAFLGPPDEPRYICAINRNGDVTDNRIANIAYVTRAAVQQRNVREGRHRIVNRKLTEVAAAEVWRLRGKVAARELAGRYGVDVTTIYGLWRGHKYVSVTGQMVPLPGDPRKARRLTAEEQHAILALYGQCSGLAAAKRCAVSQSTVSRLWAKEDRRAT